MILPLTQKYQKSVALLLLTVFYSEFVLGNYVTLLKAKENEINAQYLGVTSRLGDNVFGFDSKVYSDEDDIAKEDRVLSTNSSNNVDNLWNDSVEISGPSQPEMSSFKSVGNDNMVDLFTGDFSYNIPLMDVG